MPPRPKGPAAPYGPNHRPRGHRGQKARRHRAGDNQPQTHPCQTMLPNRNKTCRNNSKITHAHAPSHPLCAQQIRAGHKAIKRVKDNSPPQMHSGLHSEREQKGKQIANSFEILLPPSSSWQAPKPPPLAPSDQATHYRFQPTHWTPPRIQGSVVRATTTALDAAWARNPSSAARATTTRKPTPSSPKHTRPLSPKSRPATSHAAEGQKKHLRATTRSPPVQGPTSTTPPSYPSSQATFDKPQCNKHNKNFLSPVAPRRVKDSSPPPEDEDEVPTNKSEGKAPTASKSYCRCSTHGHRRGLRT